MDISLKSAELEPCLFTLIPARLRETVPLRKDKRLFLVGKISPKDRYKDKNLLRPDYKHQIFTFLYMYSLPYRLYSIRKLCIFWQINVNLYIYEQRWWARKLYRHSPRFMTRLMYFYSEILQGPHPSWLFLFQHQLCFLHMQIVRECSTE